MGRRRPTRPERPTRPQSHDSRPQPHEGQVLTDPGPVPAVGVVLVGIAAGALRHDLHVLLPQAEAPEPLQGIQVEVDVRPARDEAYRQDASGELCGHFGPHLEAAGADGWTQGCPERAG